MDQYSSRYHQLEVFENFRATEVAPLVNYGGSNVFLRSYLNPCDPHNVTCPNYTDPNFSILIHES